MFDSILSEKIRRLHPSLLYMAFHGMTRENPGEMKKIDIYNLITMDYNEAERIRFLRMAGAKARENGAEENEKTDVERKAIPG